MPFTFFGIYLTSIVIDFQIFLKRMLTGGLLLGFRLRHRIKRSLTSYNFHLQNESCVCNSHVERAKHLSSYLLRSLVRVTKVKPPSQPQTQQQNPRPRTFDSLINTSRLHFQALDNKESVRPGDKTQLLGYTAHNSFVPSPYTPLGVFQNNGT